jgi:hypothetical protein
MDDGAIEVVRSYTWTFAICPRLITIELPVIRSLQEDVEGSLLPQQGLLYGDARPGETEIDGRDPLPFFGTAEFARARTSATRPVVGFYLIREGSTFVLSDSEVALVKELFREPGSVVLVIERRDDEPAQGTFFFWRGTAFVYNLPVPFPIDAALLAETREVRAMAERAAMPAMRGFAYPVPEKRRSRAGMVAAAAVAGGVLLGAVLAYRQPNRAAASATLPDFDSAALPGAQPGNLEISWDPLAPAVVAATSAVLHISDGGMHRQIPLDLTELRSGSVVYSPATRRVRVELAARQLDGSTVSAIAATRPAPDTPARVANGNIASAERSTPAPAAPFNKPLVPDKPAVPEATANPALSDKADRIEEKRIPVKQFSIESVRLSTAPAPVTLDPPHDLPAEVQPPPMVAAKLPAALTTPTLPAPPAPSAPPAASRPVVRAGRVIWTGTLSRRGVVELDGHTVSIGSLSGALPGRPVNLTVLPAEFGDHEVVVYTTDASRHNKTEPPSAANGWNRISYQWDPERVKQLTILEAPNASNRFTRLALRSDSRRCNMILIDWVTQ